MQRTITEIVESITVVMLVYALIVALKHRNEKLKLITIYIAVSIIFGTIDVLISIFNSRAYIFLAIMYNSYDIFEFLVINFFIFSRLTSTKFRIISILCMLIYFSMCCIAFSLVFFTAYTPILAGIGYIFIAIPSLLLIFEILKSDLSTELRFNPDFLIASGCLFYYSLCVPTMFFIGNAFFTNYTLGIYQYLMCLTYVFYLVLTYTFVMAYLCPPLHSIA